MPWIVALWLAMIYVDVWPQMNQKFLLFSLLAGIAQIVATILLAALFSRRSFAVSTVFAKTEALQIALLGVLFFGEAISPLGFLGVSAGAAGLLIDDADRAGENNFTQYVASVTNEHGNHGAVIGDTVCADIFVYSAGVSSIGRTVPVY